MASTLQSRADEISEVGPLLLSAALSPVKLYTGGKLKGLLRGRIVLLGVVAPSRVLCCEWKLHSEGSFLKSSVTAKCGAKGDGTVLLLISFSSASITLRCSPHLFSAEKA